MMCFCFTPGMIRLRLRVRSAFLSQNNGFIYLRSLGNLVCNEQNRHPAFQQVDGIFVITTAYGQEAVTGKQEPLHSKKYGGDQQSQKSR